MNGTLKTWRAVLLGTCALAVVIGLYEAVTGALGEDVAPGGPATRVQPLPPASGTSEQPVDNLRAPASAVGRLTVPPSEMDTPLPERIDVRNPPRFSPVRFLPAGSDAPATGEDPPPVSEDRARMLKRALEAHARRN